MGSLYGGANIRVYALDGNETQGLTVIQVNPCLHISQHRAISISSRNLSATFSSCSNRMFFQASSRFTTFLGSFGTTRTFLKKGSGPVETGNFGNPVPRRCGGITKVASKTVDLYDGGTGEELSSSSSVPNVGAENLVELPLSAMEDSMGMSLISERIFVCEAAFSLNSFPPSELKRGRGISSRRCCTIAWDFLVVCFLGFRSKEWTSVSDLGLSGARLSLLKGC